MFDPSLQGRTVTADAEKRNSGAPALPLETKARSGITVGTKILTLDGELPVQFLAPGDLIVTRSGAMALLDISAEAHQNVEMVRIRASALGHDRPVGDVFLAAGQRLLLRDWRAQALYARNSAVVEAFRLADGEFISAETVTEVRLFTLRFSRAEVIYAEGLELVCEAPEAP